jgi:carboxynorspermidine decarboxylase
LRTLPPVSVPSPAYLIDLAAIRANCEILGAIKRDAGCRIVHALKAFAVPQVLPLLREFLDGFCASGSWEARLAREFADGHILVCGPAYCEADLALLAFVSHLDFNSLSQWQRFRDPATSHPRFASGELRCGLRVNPRCSTGPTPLYDPCAPGSRLGAPPDALRDADLTGLSGLHFHTLCEQNSDDLETTLHALDLHFGDILRRPQFTWLNMGGGHWITQPDYDRDRLVRLIQETRARYQLDEIWLEPGEAAVLRAGILRATVLDLFQNDDIRIAILDISATAHMPDVLEMPYRPQVALDDTIATEAGPHLYRLGGNSCLAGDVIGDFAFHRPLAVGDRLDFLDMAQYTLVKSTFFNGVPHPAIVFRHEDGTLETIREFGYEDFQHRLGA